MLSKCSPHPLAVAGGGRIKEGSERRRGEESSREGKGEKGRVSCAPIEVFKSWCL